MGYTQSMNDYSLFINSYERSFTTLLVYVDDIKQRLRESNKLSIRHLRSRILVI